MSAINPTSPDWTLDVGWPVVTADGQRLGVVEGVHPQHIIVSTTRPSSTMLFVPVAAITDIESDRVYLRLAMAEVFRQDWTLMPVVDGPTPDTRSGTAAMSERMQSILGIVGAIVVTVLALGLIVSSSIRLADAAVAGIFLLGLAAVGCWAWLVWHRIGRS